MLKFKFFNHTNRGTIAVLISLTATVSGFNLEPASAQLFPSRYSSIRNNVNFPKPQNNPYDYGNENNDFNISRGTTIPVFYDQGETILVTREETLPLTLTVAANIRNRQGKILIPYGTKIVGQIQPAENGSQFVAKYIVLNQNRQKLINARSQIITKTEVIEEGAGTGKILQGAAIGAAAATILAGVTGDTAIATEEVLGGAGLGALGGWLFGRGQKELIYINANTDLDLTFF